MGGDDFGSHSLEENKNVTSWIVPRDHNGNDIGFEKQVRGGHTGVVARLVVLRPRMFRSMPQAQPGNDDSSKL